MLHEAGHKWAHKYLKSDYRKSSFFKWKSLDDQKFFTDNVSENAGRKPSEAIAELFVQKLVGTKISDEAIKRISTYSERFGKWLTKKGV